MIIFVKKQMIRIAIAIHGGAGTILKKNMNASKETAYQNALETACDTGYILLEKGKTALDAVEAAVANMEDSPLFNAGRGSVYNNKGIHEMDAAIMDGKNLNAGALALVKNVKNPVYLARLIMEQTDHVFLAGEGAMEFARSINCPFEDAAYFHDDLRYNQWLRVKDTTTTQLDHSDEEGEKYGTVGAVALDALGNIAAATSTGGMTNKRYGRIGDTPLIGAGTYANNRTCAVSCTGSGEYFIRGVAAYDVSCLMEFKGLSLNDACRHVIHERLKEIGGYGGLIAVDSAGNIALEMNTQGMYRAQKSSDGTKHSAIYSE